MQRSLTMGVLVLAAACRTTAEVPAAPAALDAFAVRVADCSCPATSLPDALAAALPPRTGQMHPDDQWADLAAVVPGGFAGVFYDHDHRPVLMLTKPELAQDAKRALAGKLPGFPVEDALVHAARWDFLQLVNWYNYLAPRALGQPGVVTGDKDEVLNRVHVGVLNREARDRLVQSLGALNVPCDLVVVDSTRPVVLLHLVLTAKPRRSSTFLDRGFQTPTSVPDLGATPHS